MRATSEIIGRVKIYTRTGDSGDTALFDGTRVSRRPIPASRPTARWTSSTPGSGWRSRALPTATSESSVTRDSARSLRPRRAAGRSGRIASPGRVTKAAITPEDVARLEGWIDASPSELPPLRRFILPGGCAERRRAARGEDGLPARRAGDGRSRRRRVRGRAAALHQPALGSAVHDGARRQPSGGRPRNRVVTGSTSGTSEPALASAYAAVRALAREHYENFPVASRCCRARCGRRSRRSTRSPGGPTTSRTKAICRRRSGSTCSIAGATA